VPEDWEWKGKKESVVFMTACVFRKNVHLNPEKANVDPVEQTKAKRKRVVDAKCQVSIEAQQPAIQQRNKSKKGIQCGSFGRI
jgi:hypothetical protein